MIHDACTYLDKYLHSAVWFFVIHTRLCVTVPNIVIPFNKLYPIVLGIRV